MEQSLHFRPLGIITTLKMEIGFLIHVILHMMNQTKKLVECHKKKAGAYFNQDGETFNRGYASDAVWTMELVDSVPDSIEVTMINSNAKLANPACENENYYTYINFYCGFSEENSVNLIDETDCEAYFEVITEEACSVDLTSQVQHRRAYFMSAPIFATFFCAIMACCICAKRRRQTRILESNFSNVAFQPIPQVNAQSTQENRFNNARVANPTIQNSHFTRPNHINVPRTHFFSQQQSVSPIKSNQFVALEEYQQILNDERMARDLENELNQ